MADQVSSDVSRNLLEAAEAAGWPLPDLGGLGLDPARLRSTRRWIAWSEYLRLLRALGGPDADGPRHAALGAAIIDYDRTIAFGRLGQLVSGSEALYRLTYGWILPSTIKVLRADVDEVAPRRLRIRFTLDADAEAGEVFFWSASGTMRQLPRILGLGEAHVEPRIEAHAATYDVHLPPSRTLAARLRRAWSAFVGGDGMDDALGLVREHLVVKVEELAEANARLAEADARWRGVTARLPGLVAIVRADDTLEALDGSARLPWGVAPGTSAFQAIVPEDRALAAAGIARCRAEGVEVDVELRARDTGGATRWWACRAQRLEVDPTRVLVVAIEVTEQRRAEAALRESEHRYLHAQGLEAIGRLSGGLAHDINNVLATVHGHAELLLATPDVSADVARSAHQIVAASQRAAALTRRVLESARPHASAPAVVDLHALLRDAGALLHRLIGEDVRLVLDLAPGSLHLLVDPTSIERIVLNLAVNARDAMPTGGRLVLATRVLGEHGVLSVTDEGAGMAPEVLARAFEAFFTTKPAGVGTGLGLTTVRELVREAGGTVEIESAPGRGTTVRCVFPLVERPTRAPEPPPDTRPDRGRGEHVLLVEDQDAVRETVETLLSRLGYRTTPCASGAEALEWLDLGLPVHLLLTDVLMPGMSGPELAEAVRARLPDLPIVLMSGYTAQDPALAAHHVFLRKPFGLAQLSHALRAVLGAGAGSS